MSHFTIQVDVRRGLTGALINVIQIYKNKMYQEQFLGMIKKEDRQILYEASEFPKNNFGDQS